MLIDRQKNRHFAFGIGIHRCLGSNVARMEMRVAIEAWLERFPDFALTPDADVRWGGAQVRGPRQVPVTLANDSVAVKMVSGPSANGCVM